MKTCAIVVAALMLLSFAATACAGGGKVLLVHSYHAGYPWVDAINEGVKAAMKDSGNELEIFYMDTKRKTSDAWKAEAGALAKKKVAEYGPDVVITADDNAQQFFAKDYAGKAGPQFVFCGVNAEASKYGFPADNVTGILERPHFQQTVKMLQGIDKGVKTVAVISDVSPTSEAFYEAMKKETLPVEVVAWLNPETFEQWKAAVAECEKTADALITVQYHTVKQRKPADANDDVPNVEPTDVMSWTIANFTKPTGSVLAFGVEDGCLAGVVESGQEHGFTAATYANAIIGGKTAKDFAISTAKQGHVLLNLETAEKRRVRISSALLRSADKVFKADSVASR